jgi:hypothetical protein
VRSRFLHLDERSNQRRTRFAAEACRFALDLRESRGELRELRLRILDAIVDAGEQRRKAIALLGNFGAGRAKLLTGFNRCVAQPADVRLGIRGGLCQPIGTALGFADRNANAVANFSGDLLDAGVKRGGALGERADRAVLRAGLGGKRVELGTGARQRFEEMVRPFVAIGGEFGESFVDESEAAIDLRDHPL